jgi:putative hydrolase of the HAD superfamily
MKHSPKIIGFDSIDLSKKKGVLIDLDNTLYPYHVNHERALATCRELCESKMNISPSQFDEAYAAGRAAIHALLEGQASSHSRLLYFQQVSELLFGSTDVSFALDMEACYWNSFLEEMELFPEAKDFLQNCANQGLKICIVTDLTAQIQMRKWQKLNLDGLIHFLLSSEEAGIEKPASKIFEIALQKMELSKEEVVMIGDNHKKDVLGAQEAGIVAYLVSLE